MVTTPGLPKDSDQENEQEEGLKKYPLQGHSIFSLCIIGLVFVLEVVCVVD